MNWCDSVAPIHSLVLMEKSDIIGLIHSGHYSKKFTGIRGKVVRGDGVMNEWGKIRLEDCCTSIVDGDHQSMPIAENGIPFIVISDIKDNRIDFTNSRYVPNSYYEALDKKRKPQKGDVLYSVKGSFGIPVYVTSDQPFTFQRDIAILKCNKKVDSRYVYYVLKSDQYYSIANSLAIGSAQRAITLKTLKSIEIPYPSLDSQRKISEILAAYDSLIENNQRQIKLLEEAAQRLYKEWFVDLRYPGHENVPVVDGVPEGWKNTTMEDIADYLNGYAFKPSDWKKTGKPIIKIKEINDGITIDTPRNSGEDIPEKYTVRAGDILFSWSATLAAKIWDAEEGLLNQHLFKVTPKSGIGREFVLQSIYKTLIEFQNLTTGATMKHIQRGKLSQVHILIPSITIMNKFEGTTSPIRNRVLALSKENNLLSESRNRLLPKLMSGEIAV